MGYSCDWLLDTPSTLHQPYNTVPLYSIIPPEKPAMAGYDASYGTPWQISSEVMKNIERALHVARWRGGTVCTVQYYTFVFDEMIFG